MPITGNPKSLANDIADGYILVTYSFYKNFSPAELKVINHNLNLVLKDARGEQVPLENIVELRRKNMRIQKLNQALMVLRSYCKEHKILI